jgi:hypothetical protein
LSPGKAKQRYSTPNNLECGSLAAAFLSADAFSFEDLEKNESHPVSVEKHAVTGP